METNEMMEKENLLLKRKNYWWILIIVTLMVFFFSFTLNGKHLNPDGILYFSSLRSFFFDFDFLYTNEFDLMGLLAKSRYVTITGLEGNHVAIGTSLLMVPFYFIAFIIYKIALVLGFKIGLQGYGGIFSYVFPFGSIFYGISTLLLLRRFLKQLFPDYHIEIPLIQILVGSTFLFYITIHYELSHVCSAFAVTLFLYEFEKLQNFNEDKINFWRFAIAGIYSGIAILVRTQNGLFLVIPAFYFLRRLLKNSGKLIILFESSIFFISIFITVIPQLTMWKIINGSWFNAVEAENLNLLQPHIIETLFSSYHGIFIWTPILALSFIGLIFYTFHHPQKGMPLLLAFLLQLWINSSIFAWWEAASFGMRLFTNCIFLFTLGLCYLYSEIKNRWLIILGWCFSLWTVMLMLNNILNQLNLNNFYSTEKLFNIQSKLISIFFSKSELKNILIKEFKYSLEAILLVIIVIFFLLFLKKLLYFLKTKYNRMFAIKTYVIISLTLSLIITVIFLIVGENSNAHKIQYIKRLNQIKAKSMNYSDYMSTSFLYYNSLYLTANGKDNMAIKDLYRAIEIDSTLIEAYYCLAVLLIRNQQYNSAFAIVKKGLLMKPDNRQLKKLKSQIEIRNIISNIK